MTRLDLTTEQSDVLKEILREFLGELRMEIAGTENFEFRGSLKHQEVVVKDLMKRLGSNGN